jgi:hypothetical protein
VGTLVRDLLARIVAAHRACARWGDRLEQGIRSNTKLDVEIGSTVQTQTQGVKMEPLTGQNLNDVLATRASGNWGASFAQRAQANLGASFNAYINAYGAGGEFYKVPDPLPGNPPVPTGYNIPTGVFCYNMYPTVVAIGGMTAADFKAMTPELRAAVPWLIFP